MKSSKFGGIERFNIELARQLHANKHRTVFVYEEVPQSSAYVEELENSGGKIFVIPSSNPFLFCFKIARLICEEKATVVHLHFTPARFWAAFVVVMLRIKKRYMTLHSMVGSESDFKFLTRIWYRWASRLIPIFTVSKCLESVAKKNWPMADVRTMYLGVDRISGNRKELRQKLGLREDDFVFLVIANFNRVKGLDILADAVMMIQDFLRTRKAKVLIVGQERADFLEFTEWSKKTETFDLFDQRGIQNNVPEFIALADVYLQPSRTEGLPLSLMEASSCSLPIIATRVGGIPEIAQEKVNALLIESEDSESLAQAMKLLVEDEALRNQLSRGN
ncbi:MAG: glycosyltransferase family 4 protein, partial [Bacteroides sp.]|nr:glycosyltransferase family 4 protein [Bacteroides sp.]